MIHNFKMEKEKLKQLATNAIVIAKIKEEIFNAIRTSCSREVDDDKIINEINEIPITEFDELFGVTYGIKIKNMINNILGNLSA